MFSLQRLFDMTSATVLDTINDVFVLSTAGIPYYATCFGGEICKRRPDHLLQSGFIVAMFQFSKEFGQKTIIQVEFDEGLMVFGRREVGAEEILVVFFTTREVGYSQIRGLVDKAGDAFIDEYGERIQVAKFVNVEDYSGFSEILRGLDLINRPPMGNLPIAGKKESLWAKIRRKF